MYVYVYECTCLVQLGEVGEGGDGGHVGVAGLDIVVDPGIRIRHLLRLHRIKTT